MSDNFASLGLVDYFETVLLIGAIVIYYAVHGRKFLSLERIAEPPFIINAGYLINFPVRALVLVLGEDVEPAAPTLVWDIGTSNVVLLYASACVLVFNATYEYLSRRRTPQPQAAVATLPPLQPIPPVVLLYFVLLASTVVYFTLTSSTNINFVYDLGTDDIPQAVRAISFALDVAICGSLIMYLITRKPVYLATLAFFFASFLYYGFMLTSKYALLGYLIVVLLVLKRCRIEIRPRHLVAALLVAVPYVVTAYSVRDFDIGVIRPEETLTERIALISNLLEESSARDLLIDMFLMKATDRFVYLEAFTVYLQALQQGVALDLYDKLGSLPTYLLAIPSMFGVDKSGIGNIHVWFANKYWYGLPFDAYGVLVPFGRVTESFMIFGWAGFLFFAFYAWLFAWLYKRFYCSPDPLMVIYYLLIVYYYMLPDDVLLFNVATIAYGSVFFFGSVFALRFLVDRTRVETKRPDIRLVSPPGQT